MLAALRRECPLREPPSETIDVDRLDASLVDLYRRLSASVLGSYPSEADRPLSSSSRFSPKTADDQSAEGCLRLYKGVAVCSLENMFVEPSPKARRCRRSAL